MNNNTWSDNRYQYNVKCIWYKNILYAKIRNFIVENSGY
jgi:hypothetical protein